MPNCRDIDTYHPKGEFFSVVLEIFRDFAIEPSKLTQLVSQFTHC